MCEKFNPIYLVIKQVVLMSYESCLPSLNFLIVQTPLDQQGLVLEKRYYEGKEKIEESVS